MGGGEVSCGEGAVFGGLLMSGGGGVLSSGSHHTSGPAQEVQAVHGWAINIQ